VTNIEIYSPKRFGAMIGRTTQTLQRWDRERILPAKRTPTDRRYYTHEDYLKVVGQKVSERINISYCRVSSASQKKDLQSQKEAMEQFCIASGRVVHEKLEDIGSGLNYKRKNFISLMSRVERGEIQEIIVAHKDRLIRFGFEWFEHFCKLHGTRIIVMNSDSLSPEQEMTKDLLSIIHCFSSRLYGLRKYKKDLKKIVQDQKGIRAK
jgi:putative resolvase